MNNQHTALNYVPGATFELDTHFNPNEQRLELTGHLVYPAKDDDVVLMLESCGLHVMNQVAYGNARFVTVSESNVVMFPDNFVIKTCGNCNPLPVIKTLLANGSTLESVVFSTRKANDIWSADVAVLKSYFSGVEMSMPDNNSTFHVFCGTTKPEFKCHPYIELVCEDCRPEAMLPNELRAAHVAMLQEGSQVISSYDFQPCGYSMGALWKDQFLAVHCSPNLPHTYVSVEIGHPGPGFDCERLINTVSAWLWPKHMTVRVVGADQLPNVSKIPHNMDCAYYSGVISQEHKYSGSVISSSVYAERSRSRNVWVEEELDDLPTSFNSRTALYAHRLLFNGATNFQKIAFFESNGFGRVMTLDGHVQFTTRDEMCYQEMLTHTPLCTHTCPRNVLIVGGGDLFCSREVLKHKSVERVVVCEIDPDVTRLCSHFMPDTRKVLADPRALVIHDDAAALIRDIQSDPAKVVAKYGKDFPLRYDVIIVDSSDPVGPAKVLYEEPFIRGVYAALNEGGLVSWQMESYWNYMDFLKNILEQFRQIFARVSYGVIQIPTYPNGHIGLLLAHKNKDGISNLDKNVEVATHDPPHDCVYYTKEMHPASFVLPKFVKEALNC